MKLILRNWALVAITLLSVALLLSMSHGRALKAERDTKIAEIASMRQEAQTYAENSQRIAKEISDAHAELLVKTETHAFANAKKKFGTVARCPVVGIGTVGVLPTAPNDQGQAGSATGTDGIQEQELVVADRSFVETCALDAGVTQSWGRWAVMNDLPVSKD